MYMTRTKTDQKCFCNYRQEQLSHAIYYKLFLCNTYKEITESLSQLAAQA